MQFATLLTPEEVQQIHEASLEILDTVGLLVRSEKARALLARHGCRLDAGDPDRHLSAGGGGKVPRDASPHLYLPWSRSEV